MLSLGEEDNPTIVWSNKYISKKLQEAEDLKLIDVDDIYLSLRNKKLGSLRITGKGDNIHGRATIFCQLTLNPKEETERTQIKKPSEEVVENYQTQIIPRENLLNYREYSNLTSFPVGSVHNVEGWGYITHYGTERLVVSLDGKIFQEEGDLEEKVVKLKYMCKIRIEKIRTSIKRHVKYAVCSIFEKGDWTACVEYGNVPILSKNKMDGETCVLNVRTVEVKGQKRKLLLTDRGDGPVIYKLKKSKLEENIKVGFI
jgi:translation initiation factor 2 beta subunit (eIF-2beta)/eIF-5